ncbi:L-histidine N(alpha)-methyltransferase [Noviherbaspirillum suwonense]|uniref:Dimethylhistidine N-methyltransferase n=1 Tax=Noviherbaspirillum suwonense TaxID=1224511 RepID=A0ABY1PUZ8_9BURK|nr:L-histidine N(alpha)-methyltransferase [Noviherbaspirillum suwonense]SMP45704.1 dimethylhistidine N-methyltransferase [Noviherbaspirillum suwonense]
MADNLQRSDTETNVIRDELIAGLTAPRATTSPKYLYDALGSKLFEAICELPEYYPTRTEAAIFERHGAEIASSVGAGATLIDLGAGNCAKAARLFPSLAPSQYVPIDISADFLKAAVAQLERQFPDIRMLALGMDFSSTLDLPPAVSDARRLFFYPGSSIGNFHPGEALAFLRRLRQADGDLLIGVDLVKDRAVLDAAYDDALGVTASFNLNLLHHLNRLLGADFNLREWKHRGFFNPELSRIEMHLEARRDLTVRWNGGVRRFGEGERIHTENSYKYTPDSFAGLLQEAGFHLAQRWTDERGWFMVCHARRG